MKFKIMKICDSEAMSAVPQETVRFDLNRSEEILESEGYEVENAAVMLIASSGDMAITQYRNGRLMIHPVREKKRARSIADEFYSLVEKAVED